MSGISTSLTLKDRFTNTLNKGAASVDRMLKGMKGVDVTSRTLNPGKPFSPLSGILRRNTAAMLDFNNKQKEAGSGAEKVKSAWSGVGGLIRTALGYLGMQKAIQAIDTYVGNGARLGLITEDLEKQKALQEDIYQAAQRSRGSYNGMVSTVSKLGLLAGDAFSANGVLNTKELVAFSELMQKSFAISGASSQEQEAGLYQLTQAMAAGKLQGDEFRSIMENAPMLADAIAKFTGKSKGELKEMSAEGTITADIIKAALFSAADDIEAKFDKMPRTFASTWTQIANFATMKFGGVMETINGFLNSAAGTAMVNGILQGINLLAAGVTWLLDAITNVYNAVATGWTEIWGVLQPILQVAIPAAIGGIIASMILWGITSVKAAIATITAMSPIILIGLAIGAVIGLIIAMAMDMGATFGDVCGFIGGVLGGLFALGYNLVADAWNLIATFAEFFGNVFNNPVGSIIRLFNGLFDFVLGTLETIANAIDGIFGSNLADAINGWRDTIKASTDKMLGEQSYKLERMDKKDYAHTIDTWTAGGKAFGEGVTDTVGNLFNFSGANPFGTDLTGAFEGANIGSVGEVGKINSDVNIADEDIKLMKDVAEMRYVQNFVTLNPSVSQNIGTVNNNADVNEMLSEAERIVMEEAVSSAEDYYS